MGKTEGRRNEQREERKKEKKRGTGKGEGNRQEMGKFPRSNRPKCATEYSIERLSSFTL